MKSDINYLIYNIVPTPMDNQQSAAYIYEIATHMYRSQPISNATVNAITRDQGQQISACIGLLNIFYNQVLVLKNAKQNNNEKIIGEEEKESRSSSFEWGDTLHLRGEILRQYAFFLDSVIPQPAYSLISFDFSNFNKFCNDRGLIQLIRHSRGIYPEIDSRKTTPLQFLPYYQQLMEEGPVIIGNYNWEEARKLMKKIFGEVVIGDENYMEDCNQEEEELSTGVKLSKILLTGEWSDLQKYISEVSKRILDKATNEKQRHRIENIQLRRLNFWYRNYQKFLDQGLEYYRVGGNVEEHIALVYQCHGSNMEEIIISLVESVGKVRNQNFESWMLGPEFESKLIFLIDLIKTSNWVPTLQQEKKKCKVNKLLFLAYMHTIIKLILPDLQMENSPLKVFLQLVSYVNPMEQPYYRIFFNDNQLLELYTSGRLLQFPRNYNHGTELKSKILKAIVANNDYKLVENMDQINLLESRQKLKLLISNKLIGDIYNISRNEKKQTAGEKILMYLQKNMEQFKNILYNDKKQPITQTDTLKFYTNYLKQWRQAYHLARNFSLESFIQFIQRYQPKKINKNSISSALGNFIKKSDFLMPVQRIDVQFYLVGVFVKEVERQKNVYVAAMQQGYVNGGNHEEDIKVIRKKLIDFIKIIQLQNFKQMIQNFQIDSCYIIDDHKIKKIDEKIKCQFIDHIWSVYAEVMLMIGQLCKELVWISNVGLDINKKSSEEKCMKGKNLSGMSYQNKNKKMGNVNCFDIEELDDDDESGQI